MTDRLPSLVFIYLSGPQACGPSGESKTVEGVLQLLTQSDVSAMKKIGNCVLLDNFRFSTIC